MIVWRSRTVELCAVVVLLGGAMSGTANQRGAQEFSSRTVDQVDLYHGVTVRDPYRWLEDASAQETRAWIDVQNQLTGTYLDTAPFRRQVEERVRALNAFTRTLGPKPCCGPLQAGPYIFFAKQEPGQPQPVVFVQRGLRSTPQVLLNPNEWSADGTASLGQFAPSRDGRYVLYGVRQGALSGRRPDHRGRVREVICLIDFRGLSASTPAGAATDSSMRGRRRHLPVKNSRRQSSTTLCTTIDWELPKQKTGSFTANPSTRSGTTT